MVVPTLPLFTRVVYSSVFHTLEWLAIVPVYVLFVMAATCSMVLLQHCCNVQFHKRFSSWNLKQCLSRGCCKDTKTVFLSVGRLVCVNTFPALFKLHKTRVGHGSQTRKFMFFLDRKVENNLPLIAAFCSIVYCIFCSSAMVFLRYFPVEESGECLEKDNHDRPLFCYINASFANPSLPVDCANYSVTELRELDFECFALTFPGGLGIAVAAALGLVKVAIVGVTICVKITEGCFKMTKNPEKLPKWCCCCRLSCANTVYICLSVCLLVLMSIVSFIFGSVLIVHFSETHSKQPLHVLYYIAYTFLPMLICGPLAYIIQKMKAHCDRGEYISFSADQRPLDPRDWDEESEPPTIESSVTEGQCDEESMGGESGNINGEAPNETEEISIRCRVENEEIQHLEAGRSNTQYYGAIPLKNQAVNDIHNINLGYCSEDFTELPHIHTSL